MLVKVRKDRLTEEYVEVPSDETHTETARRIAFFHVMKRRPEDYNELVHATHVIHCEVLHPAVVEAYKTHIL